MQYSFITLWSTFLVSVFLMKILFSKQYGFSNLKKIKIFLVVLLPSILIGLRNENVGSDTYNNIVAFLDMENYSSLKSAFNFVSSKSPVYLIYRYFVFYIIGNNVSIYFSITAFLTLFFAVETIVWYASKYHLEGQEYYLLFVYYSFFGIQLLNQMRQMLALSMGVLSLIYISNNKKKYKFYIFTFLSIGMHLSTVVLYFLYYIFKGVKRFSIIDAAVFMSFIFLMFFLLSRVKFLLPDKYQRYFYFDNRQKIGLGILPITWIFLRVFIPLRNVKNVHIARLLTISSTVVLFRYMGYRSYYLYRIQYYPMIFLIPLWNYYRLMYKKRYTINWLYRLVVSFFTPFIFSFVYYILMFPGVYFPI